MRLAIVLPCYNEEAVIGTTNESLRDVLVDLLYNNDVEETSIIYVDDGSRDKTWNLIEGCCSMVENWLIMLVIRTP